MDLNFISPINQLGYGIVGLNILKAAGRLGHNVFLWPVGGVDANDEDEKLTRAAFERTRFFNPLAPCLRLYYPNDMAQMVGKGLHSGIAILELNRLNTQQRHHLKTLDVVFVPSQWTKDNLINNDIPRDRLHVVPFGVDRELFNDAPRQVRSIPLNVGTAHYKPSPPGTTTFLNIGKWEIRKGHDALLEAFNRAFTENDPVRLVMNSYNPFVERKNDNIRWQKQYLSSRLGRAGKITVLARRLNDQAQVVDLIHTADCGVFPARAEGWNLDILEMLSCGKEIIATMYSAQTEFLTPRNARLIDIDHLEDAYDGFFFRGGEGEWAALGAPQMEQLIEHMRAVHRRKQQGESLRNEAGILTAREFSWERTVNGLVSALQEEQGESSKPR